ncbi:MAG TPA: MerR family transcriptional regulator, partial [Alphaproteobacteria bacterium]|nr:MerR family transcriptional regulator [Alphaproteobacteria bacterium]
MVAKEFTVGEIAARSGLSVSALHFYERKGLIQSHRTGGNQRRYEREVLRRLAIIKLTGELGIPLSSVAKSLGTLPPGRAPNRDDWAA